MNQSRPHWRSASRTLRDLAITGAVLDADPEVYRLGYGTRSALDKVRQASKQSLFDLRVQPGVRIGVSDPSVPMKMRHGAAGNLDLRARKDDLAHAHAADT